MFNIKCRNIFLLLLLLKPLSIHSLEVWYDPRSTANIPALDVYVFNLPQQWPDLLKAMNMIPDLIDLALKTGQSVNDILLSKLVKAGEQGKKPDGQKTDGAKPEESKSIFDNITKIYKDFTGGSKEEKKEESAKPEPEKSEIEPILAPETESKWQSGTVKDKERKSDITIGARTKAEEEAKTEEKKEDTTKPDESKKPDKKDGTSKIEVAKTVVEVARWTLNTLDGFNNIFKKYFLSDILKKKYTLRNFYYVGKGNKGVQATVPWSKTKWPKDREPGVYVVIMKTMDQGAQLGQPLWQGFVISNGRLHIKVDVDQTTGDYISETRVDRLDETKGNILVNKASDPLKVTIGMKGCKDVNIDLIEPLESIEFPYTAKCTVDKIALYPSYLERNKYTKITPPGDVVLKTKYHLPMQIEINDYPGLFNKYWINIKDAKTGKRIPHSGIMLETQD